MGFKRMISVIVPVYNVEKYLAKCIESIQNQTYKDLEIILVDDGSTDSSGKICDAYKRNDSRLIVLHTKNGGLSRARNAGLEIASGDYIGFVDSDDYIEPDMYQQLLDGMVTYHTDLAECEAARLGTRNSFYPSHSGDFIMEGKEACRLWLDDKKDQFHFRPAVWSKLFQASFWKDKRFPAGKVHEDYYLTMLAYYHADRIYFCHQCLYNHIIDNPDSTTHAVFGKKELFIETQYREIWKYLEGQDEAAARVAEKKYYRILLEMYYSCHFQKMPEESGYYQKLLKRKKRILKLEDNWKRKLEFLIFYFNKYLFLKAKHINVELWNKKHQG